MKKVMPLGKKLIISYLLMGIVPALFLAGVCYRIASATQTRIIRQSLDSYRNVVDQNMKQTMQTVAMTGQAALSSERVAEALAAGDAAALHEFAVGILESSSNMNMFGFADTSGRILAWGQEDDTPRDVSKRNLFKGAMRGEVSINYSASDLSPSAVLGYFPVTDAAGDIVGVAVAGVDLTKHGFVDSIKSTFGVECTLFSGDVRVTTSIIDNGTRAIGTKMTNPEVIETVLRQRRVFQDHNVILGKGYDTIYWPMANIAGDVIGMFFVGLSDALVAEASRTMLWTVVACLAAVILITVVVASLVSRGVVGPVVTAIETLSQTAALLTDSASEIAGTSETLVQAANQQGASMQDSVSSLGELTGQARQNADTAREVRGLMDQTSQAVRGSDETMHNMLTTMEKIKESSDQVSGIVKTIEEISFQTNLLALNASVEAARAGEHGKGFAVVADEVRNLAQRAGEAAKNTSDLIGASVELSNKGAREMNLAAESTKHTLENTAKVSSMIDRVEESSVEQSQNVEQINVAVASMDKATHLIAESSGRVAETSRVLEEKSGDMDMVVDQLTAIVGAKRLDRARRKQRKKGGMKQLGYTPGA